MKTIACIDDDGGVLSVLKGGLEGLGYRVMLTTNSAVASSCLRHEHPDLILLDLKMPGKSGFDVYHELQAIWPVPVLFVTGLPEMFEEQAAKLRAKDPVTYASTRFDILPKPFTLVALADKVDSMLTFASLAQPAPAAAS